MYTHTHTHTQSLMFLLWLSDSLRLGVMEKDSGNCLTKMPPVAYIDLFYFHYSTTSQVSLSCYIILQTPNLDLS